MTTDKDNDERRLAVLLEHWMAHNRGHVEEFAKWAEKAKSSGHARVSKRILEAASQMHKANEILEDALSDLGDPQARAR